MKVCLGTAIIFDMILLVASKHIVRNFIRNASSTMNHWVSYSEKGAIASHQYRQKTDERRLWWNNWWECAIVLKENEMMHVFCLEQLFSHKTNKKAVLCFLFFCQVNNQQTRVKKEKKNCIYVCMNHDTKKEKERVKESETSSKRTLKFTPSSMLRICIDW